MGVIVTHDGQQMTSREGPRLMNDRTWLQDQRAAQQQEQRSADELQHYEAMGAGLAVLCLSFWHVLHENEAVQPANERFSRDEKMAVLVAAIRGR